MNGESHEVGGLRSFETFMHDALHHPVRGYYARNIATVGRGGDFTTTAEIAPCLARAIAAWLVRMARSSGCRDVIELGPGSGRLAAAVRKALPWWWRWRMRWHLVEKSRPLREQQQSRLGRGVNWHHQVTRALAACHGKALIYSNEFFDAFPVRVFRKHLQGWEELYLDEQGARMTETWRSIDSLPPSSIWQRDWQDGQRVEVHDAVRIWLEEMSQHWHHGAMLTIDYGAEVAQLFHRQPRGTLRGYLHQQCLRGEALYQNIGQQDLTADVNFTDLQFWSAGGQHAIFSQREFLLPWVDAAQAGDCHAIDEMGAGQAFRVWQWQRRG